MRRFWVPLMLLAAQPALVAAWQEQAEPLNITQLWPADQYISSRSPLEFALSRRLDTRAERLALVVGTVDVSSLLEVRGTRVVFRPLALRLPAGQSEAVAYIVSAEGEWREVGRFGLNVRTRAGLDEGRIVPSADLSSTGQLDERTADGVPPPDRRTYQDLTVRMGVDGTFGRSGWLLNTQGNALGVTQETQRLRWSELEGDAPAVDLTDYRVQLGRGPAHIALGNLAVGGHRYLLNGFGSRGVTGGVRLGSVATLDGGVVNGTNIVGWGNPLGVTRPSHRMSTLTLALELLPHRPGGVHIDVSGFDGSVLPLVSFNQGAATDAEQSRGWGVQIGLSDPSQRINLSGGIAQSRFINPFDPFVTGDTTIVAVRSTTRAARYGELNVQALRDFAITSSARASLGAAVRHERIDPLYRSVGAFVQSDMESEGVELTGSLGALSVQGALSRMRDNLAGIPSILTTRTRSRSISAAVPIGPFLGAAPDAWYLPNVSASWQRVHQFGVGVPVDGGFSESHVPDQMSTSQSTRFDWNRGIWTLSYGWNESYQDNRQAGRERADFRANVHAVSFGLMPWSRATASLDVGLERQLNMETRETQQLRRAGGSMQLQMTRHTSMSGSVSHSRGLDPFAGQRTRNTEYHIELSQGFNVWGRHEGGSQGRMFVRYARMRAAFHPFETPSLIAPLITWTLNAGASFRLY